MIGTPASNNDRQPEHTEAIDEEPFDSVISEKGDKSPVSGQVIAVNKGEVTIRTGRPYLISPGTMLQVEAGALVLRGDIIATLVFERQKTGRTRDTALHHERP